MFLLKIVKKKEKKYHKVCGSEQIKPFFLSSEESLRMLKVLPGFAFLFFYLALIPSHFDKETWRSLQALSLERSTCVWSSAGSPLWISLLPNEDEATVQATREAQGGKCSGPSEVFPACWPPAAGAATWRDSERGCPFCCVLNSHVKYILLSGRVWSSISSQIQLFESRRRSIKTHI